MFKQIELSYNFDALEPNIDAKTMEIHYGKHHAAYTNNLNDALKNNAPQFLEKPIEEILANLEVLPEQIRGAVRNNGGGFYNHNLYFEIMGPNAGGEPTGELAEKINEKFGSFEEFKEKFQEIDTPLLHPFQGDSTSRPMFVQPSAYENLSFALASSPELYLKKMLVAGFNKVFTVNKVFRDEIIDATHLMEFTSVEYYMAYVDYNYMMTFTEKMLKQLTYGITGKKQIPFNGVLLDFEKPWKKISIHDTLKKRFKQDLFPLPYDKLLETAKSVDITYDKPTSPGNIIIDVFEKLYLDTLIQPTFIYDFPKDASVMCYDITMAKAKRDSDDTILERFELYMGGMELANCYSELNDPEEQRAAFDLFLKQRNKDLSMDATFYHALRTGMPPASGVGFGIDRLLMILSDSSDILDTVPFSTYHESL